VTKEKREKDEIRYISYHDKLTGLFNRAFFEEEMVRLNTRDNTRSRLSWVTATV